MARTTNPLEGTAAAHLDGLLVLDEIHQCDASVIGDTVYMLGNGTGKTRANNRGTVTKQAYSWRLLFLSTGEKTLAQHMAEGGKELKAGMEVRMVGIPADAGKGLGLFEELHCFAEADELADTLTSNAGRFYGTAAYQRTILGPLHRPTAVLRRGRAGSPGGCTLLPGCHRRRADQPPGRHRLA